jgi:hypothetical protein
MHDHISKHHERCADSTSGHGDTRCLLLSQFDDARGRGDWPLVESTLDRIEKHDPDALDFKDKRYVAHFKAGQALLTRGTAQALPLTRRRWWGPTGVAG